jgi:hypothetical protein
MPYSRFIVISSWSTLLSWTICFDFPTQRQVKKVRIETHLSFLTRRWAGNSFSSASIASTYTSSWVTKYSSYYFSDPWNAFEYNAEQSIPVLHVAHKYCMEGLEGKIVSRLRQAGSQEEFLHLLAASHILASRELYGRAVRGLAVSSTLLPREEAVKIGIEAFYDVMACKQGQFSG